MPTVADYRQLNSWNSIQLSSATVLLWIIAGTPLSAVTMKLQSSVRSAKRQSGRLVWKQHKSLFINWIKLYCLYTDHYLIGKNGDGETFFYPQVKVIPLTHTCRCSCHAYHLHCASCTSHMLFFINSRCEEAYLFCTDQCTEKRQNYPQISTSNAGNHTILRHSALGMLFTNCVFL